VAFGNRDHVEVDIAARDPLVNLGKRRLPLETIFARLQRWLGVQRVPEPENTFAADYSRLFQLCRNPPRRIPGTQQQRSIGWGRNRDIDLPRHPAANGEYDEQE